MTTAAPRGWAFGVPGPCEARCGSPRRLGDCTSEDLAPLTDTIHAQSPVAADGTLSVTLDAAGRLTSCDAALAALIGREVDDLVGRDWFEVADVRDPDGRLETFELWLESAEDGCTVGSFVRQANGDRRFLEWTHTLLRAGSGAVTGLHSTGEDVTVVRRQHIRVRLQVGASRALGTAGTRVEVGDRLLASIGEVPGVRALVLWRVDPVAGGLVVITSWVGDPDDEDAMTFVADSRDAVLPRGAGLPGTTWQRAAITWLRGTRDDPRAMPVPPPPPRSAQDVAAFPTLVGGNVNGVLEVVAHDDIPRDPEGLELWAAIGAQIGGWLERSDAEEAAERSEARKLAIFDAAFDSVITMDAEGRIVELNPAAERTFNLRAEAVVGHDLADTIIPPEDRAEHRRGVARYLRTGRSRYLGQRIELNAMRSDGSVFPVEIAITRIPMPGPPLFTGYLRDITERRRAEDDLRLLAEEQAALRRVATVVASEAGAQQLLDTVTEEVGRILGAQSSNLSRYEDDDRATVLGGWSEPGVQNLTPGMTVELDGESAIVLVRRTGRPVRLDDYDSLSGSWGDHLRSLGITSTVAAPVRVGGRLWGAVVASTTGDRPALPEGSEERIAAFADLVGQALANAEARAELAASRVRLLEAADSERRRLERNLHDGAQQRLVALSLSLRMVEGLLVKDPERATSMLHLAREELGQALEELRELARGIHPAVLADRGLLPALEALVGRCPIPVDLEVETAERFPEQVEAGLYYTAAEALTNVAKYADASLVTLRVRHENGHAVVEIHDDGTGGADPTRGTGLRGLADRIEALGGRLELDSPLGGGTNVRAVVPAA